MEIHHTWEEVIDFAEELLISIFKGLRERCKYWMEVIKREYPDAGNFQIPDGPAPRIRFADGIKMLKEAGIEASADEDIRYYSPKSLTQNPQFSEHLFATTNRHSTAPQMKKLLAALSSKIITRTSTSSRTIPLPPVHSTRTSTLPTRT